MIALHVGLQWVNIYRQLGNRATVLRGARVLKVGPTYARIEIDGGTTFIDTTCVTAVEVAR